MLCWICPECGRECSPAVRECPSCAERQAAVSSGVMAIAKTLEAPPAPLLASGSQQYLLFAINGHSDIRMETATLIEEEPPQTGDSIDSLVRPLVESAEPAAPQPPPPGALTPIRSAAPAPASAELPPPAALPIEPAQFLARTVRIGGLELSSAPPANPAPLIPPRKRRALPPPVDAPLPHAEPAAFAAPAIELGNATRPAEGPASIAPQPPLARKPAAAEPPETSPPQVVGPEPLLSAVIQLPQVAPGSESRGFESEEFRVLGQALELHAESLLESLQQQIEAYESQIGAIVASFQVQPNVALLPGASAIVAAPAPAAVEWIKAAIPRITGCKPAEISFHSLTSPAQAPTLAGPCLPPELQNFILETQSGRAAARSKVGPPAWILSLVIATTLFLGAGALLQRLAANRDARQAAATPPSTSQPAASTPAAPAFEQHPMARFVEVTGLRVVTDPDHRAQVQYIVVNHAGVELSGMVIRVAVRSSQDPSSAAPLFSVSAVIPSLGPHQSKEIRTDLDSRLQPSNIPDWQHLRTDVQVGSAQ